MIINYNNYEIKKKIWMFCVLVIIVLEFNMKYEYIVFDIIKIFKILVCIFFLFVE